MSFEPGDVVWVDAISPASVCRTYPALGVIVDRSVEDMKVAFIDPKTYNYDPDDLGANHWYFSNARLANMDELTDEQIRLVTLWRLKHG